MFQNDDNIIYVSLNKTALENNYKSGIALDPSVDYALNFADLHSEDSARSWVDGVMDIIILRKDVLSIELVFQSITEDYFKKVMSALKIDEDGGFYASVFIDESGARKVLHMYRSDRNYTRHRYRGGWYYDLTVSIIQF